MTLIADGLLDSLLPSGRANKSAMRTTVIAFDDAIAELAVIAKTAAEWAADETTILAENQIGRETDTAEFKFGDGSQTWGDLPYVQLGGDLDGVADTGSDAITTARKLVVGDAMLKKDGSLVRVQRLYVNLSSAGRFNLDKTLPANFRVVLVIASTSAQVTVGIEDDAAGSSIDGDTTIQPASGGTLELTVRSNAGSAPVCTAEGNIIGRARSVPAPLDADAPFADTVTASFNFAAADYNKVKLANHASTPIVGTIQPASSVPNRAGQVVALWQINDAGVSIAAGGGVTLVPPTGRTAAARAKGSLIGAVRDKTAADTWRLLGDLAES